MPFRSEAQRRFLWAKHPDIARRWTDEYGSKIVEHDVATRLAHRYKWAHDKKRGEK